MELSTLNENDSFEFKNNKYWIVKKLEIENILFYFTIQISTPAKVVVFANDFEIVEDEEVLNIATEMLANSL